MLSNSIQNLSRWTLRLDAGFLAIAGSAGMLADAAGYFVGVGPLADTLGSPQSIGAFEAHGLATLIALFLFQPANGPEGRMLHPAAIATHLLLGTANILFWNSFVQMDLLTVGIVTTALHAAFVGMNAFSLLILKHTAPVVGRMYREGQRR